MAFETKSLVQYTFSGTGTGTSMDPFVGTFTRSSPLISSDSDNTFVEAFGTDDFFTPGEIVNSASTGNDTYHGYIEISGQIFILSEVFSDFFLFAADDDLSSPTDTANYPASFSAGGVSPDLILTPLAVCFAPDTRIATPKGDTLVTELEIDEDVLTADGRAVPVKFVGQQTICPWATQNTAALVRLAPNALGPGLPDAPLTLTGDHALYLDGLLVNASALVNHDTITWAPLADLPAKMLVYHVETENHDVILANGTPAESFVDVAGRQMFDNHSDYLALYGAERLIPESTKPRIASARLLPRDLCIRLGIRKATSAEDLGWRGKRA